MMITVVGCSRQMKQLTCRFFCFCLCPCSTTKLLALYPFFIYLVMAAICTCMEMQCKYRIPPSCCESCWDDCCCAHWCTCCVAIQMHHHTHNTQEYLYLYGSETGTYSVSCFVFHFVSPTNTLTPIAFSLFCSCIFEILFRLA